MASEFGSEASDRRFEQRRGFPSIGWSDYADVGGSDIVAPGGGALDDIDDAAVPTEFPAATDSRPDGFDDVPLPLHHEYAEVAEESDGDDGSEWQTVVAVVRSLLDKTAGVDRVHEAAVLLDGFVRSYSEDRAGIGDPASVVRLLAVTRNFFAAVDEAGLSELHTAIDSLASELGSILGADLAGEEAAGPRPPVWLDVASPAHGHVNVSGVLTAFGKGHVTTADSATVVTANDCMLATEDHYHLRRVSLDCRSLYDDEEAMAAFVYAMLDPSRDTIARLLNRLAQIVDFPADAEPQLYRRRLPTRVTTRTERAAVVAMGDGSTAHTTANYHVHDTVVPLAELLLLHPDLVRDLAATRDGDKLGRPILAALGKVEDPVLLRNATKLPSVRTSVSHSFGGTRVRLANAVMVGYGNTLITTSRVDRGRSRLTNLARLDREVARTRSAVQKRLNRSAIDEPTPPDSLTPVQRPGTRTRSPARRLRGPCGEGGGARRRRTRCSRPGNPRATTIRCLREIGHI